MKQLKQKPAMLVTAYNSKRKEHTHRNEALYVET